MLGDFFAATGFRATAFLAVSFLGVVRLVGVFLPPPRAESLPLGVDFAFAVFREAAFRGTALVAFARLVVVLDERRLAAAFCEAR